MATATVTISNIRLEGTNATAPGSVVGSDPWNDASTGTYTENTLTAPGDEGQYETAVADLSLPVTVATLNSVTVEADVTATNGGLAGTGYQVLIAFNDPTLGFVTNFRPDMLPMTGDVLETISTDATTIGSDPADLTAYLLPALQSGTLRVVRAQNSDGVPPADYTIRVHRLVLTIDYEPAGLTVTEPVTRLYPRDDALGNGSAPRIVPAPRRGRVVGGYN